MRISDWSSDVCSSDLNRLRPLGGHRRRLRRLVRQCAGNADGGGAGAAGRTGDPLAGQRAVILGKAFARRLAFGHVDVGVDLDGIIRSEEHTSELQSLMRISSAVFCLKKKTNTK